MWDAHALTNALQDVMDVRVNIVSATKLKKTMMATSNVLTSHPKSLTSASKTADLMKNASTTVTRRSRKFHKAALV